MNDPNEYIEAYFAGRLTENERSQFDELCVQDETFARQVALFITYSEGLRQSLLQQKKRQWTENISNGKDTAAPPLKIIPFREMLPYLAAACVVAAVLLIYTFSRSQTPQERAHKYITKNLTELSQTMNASKDSLQSGIAAYNNKEYRQALQIFQAIYVSNPQQSEAKKYIGLVYLITKDYEQALYHFDELITTPGLYKNPGLFLKSVTLLERNAPGDHAEAKQLLTKVVNEKAEGSREAEKWLQEWE